MHAQTLRCCTSGLRNGPEKSVAEVAFAGGTSVRLNIVPKVIIGQLEHTGEQLQKPTVDRLRQVVAKGFDLIHEGMKAFRGAFSVLPIAAVPVELLDAIGHIARALMKLAIALLATIFAKNAYFEAIGMLVTRPSSGVRVEEKLLFILFGDVVVQVLCNSKLPVKLCDFTFVSDLILFTAGVKSTYLLEGDSIVF